jgi:NAD(P)-dependent dehydrogenase (short-subunit alcohol dehydrogenase family)
MTPTSDLRVPGRVLITGAASGLGLALATRYVGLGARVLLTDADTEAGRAAARELAGTGPGTADFLPLDVRDDDAWAAAVAWCERSWGGLDCLVNNAGVAAGGRFEAISPDDWDWLLSINLVGVVRGCRAVTPLLRSQGGGQIVNIASLAGLITLPAMSSYNVAKAGVVALSQTLRYELAPAGIRVSVVCPSFFATNLGQRLRTPDPAVHRMTAESMAASPLTADDVARIVITEAARNRFLVLPHRQGKIAWRVKRIAPAVLDILVRRGWRQARRRLDPAHAEPATAAPAGATIR